ncbi:MAG: DUF4294 domain-containing protein [Bacteroidetes bacterium]|jgi:hypothetical protein|nr:DUF4294 domain-containing protein [Bacteroidota bacterium]
MRNALLTLVIILSALAISAQDLKVGDIKEYPSTRISWTMDENNDSMAVISHYTCIIVADRQFKNAREKGKWDKFKRDVKAAYPYAVLAKMKLAELDTQLTYIKGEAARKAFAEKAEKQLVDQFEKDMRNLTMAQGRILIKLVDRETGSTTYQLIKEHRGSFSAFMWQSVAFVFGNNLKSEYDSTGEDAKIEQVVSLIELGLI